MAGILLPSGGGWGVGVGGRAGGETFTCMAGTLLRGGGGLRWWVGCVCGGGGGAGHVTLRVHAGEGGGGYTDQDPPTHFWAVRRSTKLAVCCKTSERRQPRALLDCTAAMSHLEYVSGPGGGLLVPDP
jgi:hypothetical protein